MCTVIDRKVVDERYGEETAITSRVARGTKQTLTTFSACTRTISTGQRETMDPLEPLQTCRGHASGLSFFDCGGGLSVVYIVLKTTGRDTFCPAKPVGSAGSLSCFELVPLETLPRDVRNGT